jgi:murein tripeptide amidase MpaA
MQLLNIRFQDSMINLPFSREKKPIILGRIIMIEKCVASKDQNMFELAEGTEFYMLTVESVPDEFGKELEVLEG